MVESRVWNCGVWISTNEISEMKRKLSSYELKNICINTRRENGWVKIRIQSHK